MGAASASAAILPATSDRFRPESFEISTIPAEGDASHYQRLLMQTYEPLGFMTREFLPTQASERFLIRYAGTVVAIFRLTEVEDAASPYFDLVPGARTGAGRKRLLEVNNVIIASAFRSSILLGLMLYECAKAANRLGYDYVVGITRHQTLRFFVDFGVIPVDHPPLQLLGKDHLLDFVIYYDTQAPDSLAYMHERARRYFHQLQVMRSIQEKYVKPSRPRSPDEAQLVF